MRLTRGITARFFSGLVATRISTTFLLPKLSFSRPIYYSVGNGNTYKSCISSLRIGGFKAIISTTRNQPMLLRDPQKKLRLDYILAIDSLE